MLLESLDIDDKQLHPRTELAKIYQRQANLMRPNLCYFKVLKSTTSSCTRAPNLPRFISVR